MNLEEKKLYIESVPEYIEEVLRRREILHPNEVIWFRGEGSENFPLLPNLYRKTLAHETRKGNKLRYTDSLYHLEQNIDGYFFRRASIFFSKNGIKDTPWNRYFLKQHYKVHTRLLDWTESALIALFFALSDSDPKLKKENAKVILLAPFKLNNYSVPKLLNKTDQKYYYILTCSELPNKEKLLNEQGLLRENQLLRKYYRLECDEGEELYPIAIYPQHLDERMASQQACFTMFGNMIEGFNFSDNSEQITDYIYIDSNSKDKILKELRVLGINFYSVYPDLDGLGKAINEESYQRFISHRERDNDENLLSSL